MLLLLLLLFVSFSCFVVLVGGVEGGKERRE